MMTNSDDYATTEITSCCSCTKKFLLIHLNKKLKSGKKQFFEVATVNRKNHAHEE